MIALQQKIKQLENELATRNIDIGKNVTDSDKVSQTYKEYMELRLAETMAEARRHH